MYNYSLDNLSRMIDHTNLKPDVTYDDMKKLCDEAKEFHFKMVAINQSQSKLCAELLKGTDINIGAAIGFPLGQTTIDVKVFETKDAIKNGATEIDYVINITELKGKNYDYIESEMREIVAICKENNIISKVIFENCYLEKDEIIKLCEIANIVKPDFIKTSTGFGTGGATFEDIKLMKENISKDIKVKAAGGIRDLDTFLEMLKLGVERVGTSSGMKIISDLENKLKLENKTFIEI